MNLNRRTVVATALASPLIMRTSAAANEPQAGIEVSTTRHPPARSTRRSTATSSSTWAAASTAAFSRRGSPLSDATASASDVLEATKKLNVTILRWPGGNFASNYHWKDGIGPRDQRPPRLEMAWGTVESNRFGTHEFLQYCEMATEPYICVNLGTGTWTEAQQWVEYCNSSEDTAMTPPAQAERPRRAVEGDVLGSRQRDGWPVADGPPRAPRTTASSRWKPRSS